MNVLIVDNGSRHVDEIANLFPDANITRASFEDFRIHDVSDDTLAVLSGGAKLGILRNLDKFENEIEFIRKFGGPIIGICLGFELIAHAYGSQLYKMDERRSGLQTITATDEGREILPEGSALVREAHRWNVRSLGRPLISLARSEDGVELLRHESRNIYGAQFHPELYEGNNGKEIFARIMDDISIIN